MNGPAHETTHRTSTPDLALYVCPSCRGPLEASVIALSCGRCRLSYPIVAGEIPSFILEDLGQSSNPLLRWANRNYDRQARFYEWTRYPWRLRLYGGWRAPSLEDLVRETDGYLGTETGLIIDVACGPGTLGRRLASPRRSIYGIDISMAMLVQGVGYLKRQRITGVHFARALAEALPFPDARFDAAVCGAALHLVLEPAHVLREISRSLKPGAPLAAITTVGNNHGIFRFRRIRNQARRNGSHLFELPALEALVNTNGFEDFRPRAYGSTVLFFAHKRRA
jgi:ubiquinone/menaquinone biosynthesis C-methylase UbiE/uncharacterized protein YbaR (Trm112 family)